jgi:hypothetical protein
VPVGIPALVGLCAAVAVFALGAQPDNGAAAPGEAAVPSQLAGYSYLMANVSDSPPGPAVALYQHGFGVEFMDFPQAVALGAGGDVYRRVDAAEDRAGAETQGDPAPMLLSPDGTKVAVGDHDTTDPDVVVVDLETGRTTVHPLPSGRSVLPVAWSRDGTTLAHLLSPEPTNPYTGERISGAVGVLDLDDDTTDVLPGDDATAAAFSPDGTQLAVEHAGAYFTAGARLSVVDLASGDERRLSTDGVLAGPASWSPDGRLLATTTLAPSGAPLGVADPGSPTGLSFVDASGQDADVPAPVELPLSGPGRVLGWTDAGAVLTLLDVETADACCGPEAYSLSAVPLDGSQPRALMRVSGLQSYGVGRFQLASATVGDLQVVSPARVDHGDWPWAARIVLALLAGFAAWLVARVVRRIARALFRRSRSAAAPAHEEPALSAS